MYYLLTYFIIGILVAGCTLVVHKRAGNALYVSDILRIIFVVVFWPMVLLILIPWERLPQAFKDFGDRKVW